MIKGKMNQSANYSGSTCKLEIDVTIQQPMTGNRMTTYHIPVKETQKVTIRETDEGRDIIVIG